MAMRTQELHPSLVHFPIALLPVSLGADLLGRATGSRSLCEMGRYTMALAAAGAALSAVTGLIAQEEVQAAGGRDDEHADRILITHRNLNVGLVGLTTALATTRNKNPRPGAGYFLAGLAGVGTMLYSAYLGGKMVYSHGLGVEAADGVRRDASVELDREHAGEALRKSTQQIGQGAQRAVRNLAEGKIVPALRREPAQPRPGPASVRRRGSGEPVH